MRSCDAGSNGASDLDVPEAPGGRQGSTVQVTAGGQFLDGVAGVLVSGTGVQGRIADFNKPLNGQALSDLRDKVQALQPQASDPAVQRQIRAIRDQLSDSQRRNAAPVLSEIVTIEYRHRARR